MITLLDIDTITLSTNHPQIFQGIDKISDDRLDPFSSSQVHL